MAKVGDFPKSKRFRLVQRAGEGTFGVVYEAYDAERDASVAMKVLRDDAAGDTVVRFKNEFRGLQELTHPNIIRLHELIHEDGQWFFTMEFVRDAKSFIDWVRPEKPAAPQAHIATERIAHLLTPGGSPRLALATLPPRKKKLPPLNVERLRDALRQLAIGVHAIHATGRLHRDLKPSNVLVTPDGRVVLVDFGLASRPGERQEFCTPAYMAPDSPEDVSPAADWYSVGVMLYEALTGDIPFSSLYADLDQAMEAKQHTDPPPPRLVVPEIPEALDAMCMALLERDPKKRMTGNALLRQLSERTHRHSFSIQPPINKTFVGRKRELAQLEAAFAISRAAPVMLLVSGESGVGKSELVQQFTPWLQKQRAVTLRGSCYERESVPYKAWDGLIDQLTQFWSELSLEDAYELVPPFAMLLQQAFPALRKVSALARQGLGRGPSLITPAEQRNRVFAALREIFRRIADDTPLVLIIDDIQWADEDSLALLEAMFGGADVPNMLLLATARNDEANEHNAAQMERLRKLPHLNEVALQPLDQRDAAELASRLAPGQSFDLAAVVAESGGHPLFIEELLRAASQQVGAVVKLESAMKTRIEALAPLGRELLATLAVAGQPIAREAATIAMGASTAEVVAQVDTLRDQHLVRSDGTRRSDRVSTYHDRVKRTILAMLGPEELRGYHGRLASAFSVMPNIDPEVLAFHWKGAGDELQGLRYTLLAADQAYGKLAFDRAERLYRAVLGSWPKDSQALHAAWPDRPAHAQVWERLGMTLANNLRGHSAADAFREAANHCADPSERTRYLQLTAAHLLRSGQVDEGQATIAPILHNAGVPLPASRGGAVARLLTSRARLALRGGPSKLAQAWLASPSPPDEQKRPITELCWTTMSGLFNIDQLVGMVYHARYFELALKLSDPSHLARACAMEAVYLTANNVAEEKAAHALVLADTFARRSDHLGAATFVRLSAAPVHFLRGEWMRAREACEAVLPLLLAQHNSAWEVASAQQILRWSMCYGGDLRALKHEVERGLADAHAHDDLYAQMSARTGFPNITWLAEDNPRRARKENDDATAQWSQRGYHLQHVFEAFSDVHISLYEGDIDRAVQSAIPCGAAARGAGLLRVQANRAMVLDLVARAKLAACRDVKDCPEVAATAKALRRERRGWIVALALLLDAQLCGEASAYEAAAQAFAAEGMRLHEASARLASGVEAQTAAALAYFSAEGVADPRRLARVFVPGAEALRGA